MSRGDPRVLHRAIWADIHRRGWGAPGVSRVGFSAALPSPNAPPLLDF
jgi:hypothetical protein